MNASERLPAFSSFWWKRKRFPSLFLRRKTKNMHMLESFSFVIHGWLTRLSLRLTNPPTFISADWRRPGYAKLYFMCTFPHSVFFHICMAWEMRIQYGKRHCKIMLTWSANCLLFLYKVKQHTHSTVDRSDRKTKCLHASLL